MKKGDLKKFYFATAILTAFVLWTVAVRFIDVEAIGPLGSCVGLATLNLAVHEFIGVNMTLYTITDWLGVVPFCFVFAFALLGAIQLIRRKSLMRVERSILILGGFYIAVMAFYVFFEIVPINFRPVLIEGVLEVSYPSSTTMLVMCVMPTAIMQFNSRIKNTALRRCVAFILSAFVAFMVIGRIISGVHWISDIIGGALISSGLVEMYRYLISFDLK